MDGRVSHDGEAEARVPVTLRRHVLIPEALPPIETTQPYRPAIATPAAADDARAIAQEHAPDPSLDLWVVPAPKPGVEA